MVNLWMDFSFLNGSTFMGKHWGFESLFIFTVYLLIKSYSFIYWQWSYVYIYILYGTIFNKTEKNDDIAFPIYL